MRIAITFKHIVLYTTLIITTIASLVSCVGEPVQNSSTFIPPEISPSNTPSTLPAVLNTVTPKPTSTKEITSQIPEFDGDRALQDIQLQVDIGPRAHGSEPHSDFIRWIDGELSAEGWQVDVQETEFQGQEISNIIAKLEKNEDSPWVILGAHYDTRLFADNDQNLDFRTTPVPGANDGASGVAVLLELARVIPADIEANLWLVFFDAEDNGGIPGYEWILGSTAFVESLDDKPDTVLVIDMVGDKELNINVEKNSDPGLSQEIWKIAASFGYSEQFIDIPKHRIIDDHLPFIQAEIPAVLIIDIEYPYWHQTTDTIDKVSPASLKIVGDVILNWLITKYGINP